MAYITSVSIKDDSNGNKLSIDGLGSIKSYETSMIVGESFEGSTLDTNFWEATLLEGGTVTQDGEILIETNTSANGEASVDSARKARKIPGTVGQFRAVGHFVTAGQANNVRTVGLSDFNATENGAYFKLDGTTFKVGVLNDNTPTEVSSGSFNGDVTTYVMDTNIHRFAIEYTAYIAKFWIDGVLIHSVIATTEPWTKSLTLGIRCTNINSGDNATDNQLHFQLLTILRLGQLRSAKKSSYQSGTVAERVLKYGAGAIIGMTIGAVVNGAVVTLYDDVTATAGNEIFSTGSMTAKVETTSIDLFSIDFFDGLTLAITGANCNVSLIYE